MELSVKRKPVVLDSGDLHLSRQNLALLCDESVVYGVYTQDGRQAVPDLMEHMVANTGTYDEQLLGFCHLNLVKIEDPSGKPIYARSLNLFPLGVVTPDAIEEGGGNPILIAYYDLCAKEMLIVKQGDAVPYAQLDHIPTIIADQLYTIAMQGGHYLNIDGAFANAEFEHCVQWVDRAAIATSALAELGINFFDFYAWWISKIELIRKERPETIPELIDSLNNEFNFTKPDFNTDENAYDSFYKNAIVTMLNIDMTDEWKTAYGGALHQLWTNKDKIKPDDLEWFKTVKFDRAPTRDELVRLLEIATAYAD